MAHFDGITWTVFDTGNSGLPNDVVQVIVTDPNGTHWFGTYGGVGVRWNLPSYLIQDSPLWTDQSTGAPTNWLWNFGDGITSTLQNPAHIYTQAGIYTVSLLVSGPSGSDWIEAVGYIVVLAGPSDMYIYLPVITR